MKFTDEQRAAISTTAKNVVVDACPGSGKTTTIIERIRHLMSGGEDAGDIAVVTYTNAAARVIEERINSIRDYSRLGFVGTLHSFCLRHLSDFGGWPQALRVIDEDEANERLRDSAKRLGSKAKYAELWRCRENWLHEMQAPETAVRIVVRRYYAEMVREGTFDYNSLLFMALMSLGDRNQKRRAWSHLIVDEYQDASDVDAAIYAAAAADNRFYVGDPMQSIFAFRGGRVEEILKLLDRPGWTRFDLSTNFRSLPAICEPLNALASRARIAVETPETRLKAVSGHLDGVRPPK